MNGAGAIAVLLMCLTGAVIWWPGIARWREHLVLRRGVGWRRFTWQLHGVFGFWSFAFLLVLAVSGMYLCFPDHFAALADWLQPPTNENAGTRFVDSALYWLAYLHFGRINGIGIPCNGPGLCDQTTKAVWAIVGALPAAMFVTGVDHVVEPRRAALAPARRSSQRVGLRRRPRTPGHAKARRRPVLAGPFAPREQSIPHPSGHVPSPGLPLWPITVHPTSLLRF